MITSTYRLKVNAHLDAKLGNGPRERRGTDESPGGL